MMMNDITVVFFDLFFTLVTPKYCDLRNENDVLMISHDEWEKYAEDTELYIRRATGIEKNPRKIIDEIICKMGKSISEIEKNEILELREERFKKSLMEVDSAIIEVLIHIKKTGKKLCLISNADIIDVMHWNSSPLNQLFDATIFSYEVGHLKPEAEIYRIALKKMNVNAEGSVFIGDGGSDEIRGAKAVGINTILTGYLLKRDKEELNKIKEFADYYIDDIKEIKNML